MITSWLGHCLAMPLGCVTKGTLEEPVSRSKWGLTPNGRLQQTLHTAGTWRQYLLLSLTQWSPSPSGTKPLGPQLPLGPDGLQKESPRSEDAHTQHGGMGMESAVARN